MKDVISAAAGKLMTMVHLTIKFPSSSQLGLSKLTFSNIDSRMDNKNNQPTNIIQNWMTQTIKEEA
jgi:hypothetical protein